MSDEHDEAARAMTWRAVQEIQGLDRAKDQDLMEALMRALIEDGYSFDHLEAFRGARRINCFGVFRDHHHYAGMCRIDDGVRRFSGIMAQTTGEFEGAWVFMLDHDSSVLTSRNGEAISSVGELEGPELIRAVISSSMTEDCEPAKTSFWRRRR